MKKIKCMAVFAMLLVMAVFSSCGAKMMSISEAVEAIGNLKHGESITIVLDKNTAKLTEELREALSADIDYLIEIMESEGIDGDNSDERAKFFQKYAKKVKLDLSKTKITEIKDEAFGYCVSLASVIMPNSVTTIRGRAFLHCGSLTSVTMPKSVTTIGNAAFGRCISLASVTIPNSVTTIEMATFMGCSSLTSVTIPNSVTSIDYNAFMDCESHKSVNIPDSVTELRYGAFDDDVMVKYKGKTDTWKNIYDEYFWSN